MAQALTAPALLAAAVLCVAGVAKLRSPHPATRAFEALGLPARPALVRSLAAAEIAIGIWCAIDVPRPALLAVACLYAAFAVGALLLSRGGSPCGCFGAESLPAPRWQGAISAVLAVLALSALAAHAHGLGWVIDRPGLETATILIGIAGAAYAILLAYTLLPQAWASWSAQ